MANSLILEDIKYAVDCESCDYPYVTQLDIDSLVFVRSTLTQDIYRCNHCHSDKVYICKKGEE